MALILALILLKSARCSAETITQDDESHPRAFVKVVELDRNRHSHLIYSSDSQKSIFDSAAGKAQKPVLAEQVDATVDTRSRILILFDRAWIKDHIDHVDIDPTVSAQVKGKDGTRPIEVTGYAYVGQQAQGPSMALRNLSSLKDWNTELEFVWGEVYEDLWEEAKRVGVNRTKPAEFDAEALDAALSEVPDAKTDDFVQGAAQRFKIAQGRFNSLTARLERDENSRSVQILAHQLGRDVEAFKQDFRDVADKMKVALGEPAVRATPGRDVRFDAMREVMHVLSFLVADPGDTLDFSSALVSAIKDADILVPLSGAVPGDNIIIEIKNQADLINSRSLRVKLNIRQYGLIRTVTDAAFFVHRLGVGSQVVSDATAAAQQAAASGESGTTTTPGPASFAPAPGVTLAWTYHGWPDAHGKLNPTAAVEPSLGINASFIRFGSVVSAFAPGSGSSPPTATVQDAPGDIDVGLGVVAGLFDNALQFTVGWDLMEDTKRAYFGIGLSFFKVASAAQQLATSH